MSLDTSLIVRDLGCQPYEVVWKKMKIFTNERDNLSLDEFWIVEHEPVFTQGQAGKSEHVLKKTKIPVIQSDRGGQVTYHGPGQLIVYVLMDIKRKKLNPRNVVDYIEQSVIDLLNCYRIKSYSKSSAPGVYVNEKKISALGLRFRKGKSYHGLSLNVDMDLSPFEYINPCGYEGMKVIKMSDLSSEIKMNDIKNHLIKLLMSRFGYLAIENEINQKNWCVI